MTALAWGRRVAFVVMDTIVGGAVVAACLAAFATGILGLALVGAVVATWFGVSLLQLSFMALLFGASLISAYVVGHGFRAKWRGSHPLTVGCGTQVPAVARLYGCDALPGKPCKELGGEPMGGYHDVRKRVAALVAKGFDEVTAYRRVEAEARRLERKESATHG